MTNGCDSTYERVHFPHLVYISLLGIIMREDLQVMTIGNRQPKNRKLTLTGFPLINGKRQKKGDLFFDSSKIDDLKVYGKNG